MEVVEQDQRRLLDRLEVAQGGVEVGGARVEPGRGRAPGDVERGPGSNPSQGFADDPEVERGLDGLSAAHSNREPGSLLGGPFQHTRFAEPSFGDHEQGLPLPGARAFENKSDGRHYAFPFEHGVPARILSLRGLTDDPPPTPRLAFSRFESRSSAGSGGAQAGVGPPQAAGAVGSSGLGPGQWPGPSGGPGSAASSGPPARARQPVAADRVETPSVSCAFSNRSPR